MPVGHFTPQPSNNSSKTCVAVPDAVIEDFLGSGLSSSEWPAEVTKRGYAWYPGLKNIIIEKQWERFKPEIQRLQSEPKIAQSSRFKSNSLESISKRLKGEPWAEGRPDEREERLRTRRLLGKDAGIRCLQNYVAKWKQEADLSTSERSVQNAPSTSASENIPIQPIAPVALALEIGSVGTSPEVTNSHRAHLRQPGITSENVDTSTNALTSTYGCDSQAAYSTASPLAQHDPLSSTPEDFQLLHAFQNAVPNPDSETSYPYLASEPPDAPVRTRSALSHDTAIAPFDNLLINEEDVPGSARYSQGFVLPEPEPNPIEWMETNQVSESFDFNDFLEDKAFGAESATEAISAVEQDKSQQGCPETLSRPISSACSSSKGRKRRRQHTPEMSLDMPGYGNATTRPPTSQAASDRDTIMSGYESSSQYTRSLASQEPWTESAPPSESLSISPSSRTPSEPAYTQFRARIKLESELQRMKQELESVQRQHKKELESVRKQGQRELDSLIRQQQAAEAEISELRDQVREMKASNEYYEGQVRELLNKNIILQGANSRKKSVSGRPPTGTKEREHNAKPVQNFPSSKKPRPLSLTFRPATASNSSSPSRKLSAATLQDTSPLRLPIPASSSSRPGSANNSPVSPENPMPPKLSNRRNRPSSADSAQVSSDDPTPAPSPSKSAGRNNRSGSTDNIITPNISTTAKLKHMLSSSFLRKPHRDDSNRSVPAIPTLPVL